MIFIYVLELSNGKFYIGRTKNPDHRLSDHFESNGSGWTKLHPPVKIIEMIPNCDEFDEDKYTIKYMKDKGIDNVRGGTFCQLVLDPNQIETINKMIYNVQDTCYHCGKPGHFAKNCYKKKFVDKNQFVSSNSNSNPNSKPNPNNKKLWNKNKKENNKDKKEDLEPKEKTVGCEYCKKMFSTVNGKNYHVKFFCKSKPVSANDMPKYKNIHSNVNMPNEQIENQDQTDQIDSEDMEELENEFLKLQEEFEQEEKVEHVENNNDIKQEEKVEQVEQVDQIVGSNNSVGSNNLVESNNSVGSNNLVESNNSVGSSQVVNPESISDPDEPLDLVETTKPEIKKIEEPGIQLSEQSIQPTQPIQQTQPNQDQPCTCFGSNFSSHTVGKCVFNKKIKKIFGFV